MKRLVSIQTEGYTDISIAQGDIFTGKLCFQVQTLIRYLWLKLINIPKCIYEDRGIVIIIIALSLYFRYIH